MILARFMIIRYQAGASFNHMSWIRLNSTVFEADSALPGSCFFLILYENSSISIYEKIHYTIQVPAEKPHNKLD